MNDILIILVIYNIRQEDSLAYGALQRLLDKNPLQQCLYVHDNSPCNKMLSGAYNEGLKIARRQNKQWILLLDEDTLLTKEYLDSLQHLDPQKDAFVPILTGENGNILSPFWYSATNGPFAGLYQSPRKNRILSAFNSGVILKCKTMETIGEFSSRYPLDYLDYWLFRRLYLKNAAIEILDVKLSHNLSIEDYSHVSSERYRSILSAEKRFAAECGKRSLCFYRWHLTGRLMKWLLTGHPYIKETYKALVTL